MGRTHLKTTCFKSCRRVFKDNVRLIIEAARIKAGKLRFWEVAAFKLGKNETDNTKVFGFIPIRLLMNDWSLPQASIIVPVQSRDGDGPHDERWRDQCSPAISGLFERIPRNNAVGASGREDGSPRPPDSQRISQNQTKPQTDFRCKSIGGGG